jgi:succinate dehydrogenase/fumarate reductase flavoprotein subunit
VLHAALTRQESRGMHQRADAPGRDPRFVGTVRAAGFDPVTTTASPAYETERAS